MPQYHFRLNECGKIVEDADGREVRDLETARIIAVDAARDIMAHDVKNHGQICLSCRIDVIDDQGGIALTVPFKDAVTVMEPGVGC